MIDTKLALNIINRLQIWRRYESCVIGDYVQILIKGIDFLATLFASMIPSLTQ